MINKSGVPIKAIPTSIPIAITTIFARVPKPGFSLSGIQSRRTRQLIRNVALPMVISLLVATPWARTDHGALPSSEIIIKLSPIPKIKRPKVRIETLDIERSQRCEALQGVIGMVL
jgi:hypothetical protein